MEKNVQFAVSWREASRAIRKLKASNLRYVARQSAGKSEVVFVFPNVSISQYVYLYILFGTKAADAARSETKQDGP